MARIRFASFRVMKAFFDHAEAMSEAAEACGPTSMPDERVAAEKLVSDVFALTSTLKHEIPIDIEIGDDLLAIALDVEDYARSTGDDLDADDKAEVEEDSVFADDSFMPLKSGDVLIWKLATEEP